MAMARLIFALGQVTGCARFTVMKHSGGTPGSLHVRTPEADQLFRTASAGWGSGRDISEGSRTTSAPTSTCASLPRRPSRGTPTIKLGPNSYSSATIK